MLVKSDIGQELELWVTSFILSMGIILSLGGVAISFWYIWESVEDKSIAVFSILVIVSTTIVMRNFLKGKQ